MKRPQYTPEHSEIVQDKRNHYTVTPIANIETWRKEEAIRESKWHSAMLERFQVARQNAISGVKGEKAVELIADLESQYIDARKTAKEPAKITWEQIKAKMDNWDVKNTAVLSQEYNNSKPNLVELIKRFITRISK